ncbi:alpha/beta hydrolase family protein [Williamsia sp. CHRR-6]|uniref:alpha/beta hydrolase n=1 Tax=Williamsia sp. CHRR-6 TaxID=2835871 RepID=UPI001BDA9AD0|nr:alpha/beta hydrolase family protein [Williamsia sp. CHRR-6]MBT0565551.1 esterase family protein [Williamsia sp. CHRR-6]
MSWTIHTQPSGTAAFRLFRSNPRVLRPAVIVVSLSVLLFAATTLFSTSNRASALVGHAEVLRPGCTWDSSGNFVQNCKVYSPSQRKTVIVQIRASNDSTRGVYMLDGMRAREDRSAWTTDVQASRVYDGKSNVTLVMPVGGASSFYTDWNAGAGAANTTIKQETFLTAELPDYLERNFGVARSGNAIVGISMSAGPAVTLAQKHPEQFKVVQAMSGYYQINNPLGALGVFATQSLVSNYTNGITNMWGTPGSAQWQQNDPSQNLDKLKQNGQVLIVSSGNGFLTPQDMARLSPQDRISAVLLEVLSAVSTVLFQLQSAQAGVSTISLPNFGGHNWANWNRGLQAGRDKVLDAMKAAPPVTQKTTVLTAQQIAAAGAAQSAQSSTSPSSSAQSSQPGSASSSAPAPSSSGLPSSSGSPASTPAGATPSSPGSPSGSVPSSVVPTTTTGVDQSATGQSATVVPSSVGASTCATTPPTTVPVTTIPSSGAPTC